MPSNTPKPFFINQRINPQGLKKDTYDVIIIGAGIGGLVCGCYLAKAGLKVLIVEKNPKVGGYCQSFTRDGFTFDACVHYLGSLREDGQLRCVLRELELESEINFIRMDPSDVIITSKDRFVFYRNVKNTIDALARRFFSERKNIERFFNDISKGEFFEKIILFKKYITFGALLEDYFKNKNLRQVLYH